MHCHPVVRQQSMAQSVLAFLLRCLLGTSWITVCLACWSSLSVCMSICCCESNSELFRGINTSGDLWTVAQSIQVLPSVSGDCAVRPTSLGSFFNQGQLRNSAKFCQIIHVKSRQATCEPTCAKPIHTSTLAGQVIH